MNSQAIYQLFKAQFDVVGLINTSTYFSLAKKLGIKVSNVKFKSMAVVALAYPKRILHHDHEYLIPSFYTFGADYHTVLKNRMAQVVYQLDCNHELAVDNHPHNERLAAVAAGIGFFGKNQLIINKDYGSYIFLGIVFLDLELDDEIIQVVDDDCGECIKCLQACPTKAITNNGFEIDKCISHYNQSKRDLTAFEMKANYLLFGCDICQIVCPKNNNKGKLIHPEFELNGNEKISIFDLYTLSEKQFKNKYSNTSYLWKGKTVLMRNGLLLLLKHRIKNYNDLIADSINNQRPSWYNKVATLVLDELSK